MVRLFIACGGELLLSLEAAALVNRVVKLRKRVRELAAGYEKLKALGSDINALFSTMQKLNVLKDLCIISNADGKIDEKEIANLYGLAGLLGIKDSFIDATIGDMNAKE